MSVCANCGTAQGPFTRTQIGPICAKKPGRTLIESVRDCNGRRRERDEATNTRRIDDPKER